MGLETGGAGLRHSGRDDAVQEERDWNDGRVGRRCRVERDREALQYVRREEMAAVRREVVVDGETSLRVERLSRRRLHETNEYVNQWRRQRREGGEASPLWVDVQKSCNMCVLSLSWNFFVSHDKYQTLQIPYLCTAVNVSASGGLRTLDPL